MLVIILVIQQKSAYSQLESGKRQPSLYRLGLLSKLYGVSVNELVEG
ncbi:helix-turn-helix domain-containing protein [Bacillus cereus]